MARVILETLGDGVGRITLNDPQTRNAGGRERRILLHKAFVQMFDDPDVRAIILTGAGGNFSAGGDIKEFGAIEVTEQLTNVRGAQVLLRCMLQGTKPVVAAVEGFAAGAGVSLACACDVIVGDPGSKFALTFVRVGMVPDMGLHVTLAHRLGIGRARAALMLGQTFAGRQAADAGLIDEFVEEGQVQARALELARQLAAGPPVALASYKRGFYVAAGTIDAVAEFEAAAMAVALTGKEVREGAAAFLEKRTPRFHG